MQLTGGEVRIPASSRIPSPSMAWREAKLGGVDLSTQALTVADLHSPESGVAVTHEQIAAEALAMRMPASVDVVTCMEMLQHVPDPGPIVRTCATPVRRGK